MPAVWRPPPDAAVSPAAMPTEHTQFVTGLSLAAVPTAVSAARRYVRHELERAGLMALADDAELVSSELVTNAVAATGVMATDPSWSELDGLALIRIRLGFSASSVIVEVWDGHELLPGHKQADVYAESGRGLFIVAALCTKWDARRVSGGGKVVRGELARPKPEELPRRVPKRRAESGQRGRTARR